MKVHFWLRKKLKLDRVLSQTKPSSTHEHVSLWLILMLASHLRLCLPIALFPLVFPTKILYLLFRMYGIRPACPYPFKVVTMCATGFNKQNSYFLIFMGLTKNTDYLNILY